MNKPISRQDLKQSKYGPISFYRKLTDKSSDPVNMERVLAAIKSGKGFSQVIEELRKEASKTNQTIIKKKLPAVTVSGLFGESRKLQHLQKHSGFIQIDFDEVPNLQEVISWLQKDKYSFAIFLSPSGSGIKVLVRIPANIETHTDSFRQLSAYYQKEYGLKPDEQCKDVTRLMFLSHDKDLFVNEQSERWAGTIDASIFVRTLANLERTQKFEQGRRNDFVFKLACDCCKAGFPISDTIAQVSMRYAGPDFPPSEIETTIKSAYSNKTHSQKPAIEGNNSSGSSLLRRSEIYLESKYEIRLNVVNGRIEYREKESNLPFAELNEANIFRELHHSNIPLSIPKISILLQSDFVPKHNPFESYFERLGTWKKETEPDLIDKLCEYLPVTDKERFRIQFKKWLVRCIACALEPNVFNKQVLVLVGEGQNTGKSTFCRWLCPPALNEYFTEYVSQDKDGLIALSSNFLINLDELATLSKADINSLKSLISKDKISVRFPYAKRSSTQPRRANFIGSTNNDEFLVDETGNVRWQCFDLVEAINFGYSKDIDINDIWRQAYSFYKDGFEYQLTAEEIKENEGANSKHLINTPEIELIYKYFQPASKDDGIFKTATDILEYVASRHLNIKLYDRRIGKALKILGFVKLSNYTAEKGYSIKGYYVNEKK